MGRLLQLLFTRSGGKTLSSKMFGLCALLLFTSVAQALPFGGDVQCTLNYNIVHEEKCHHKQVCHEEHEVVVTTTLIEECEDIVTKHCHNEHKNVYHTTNVAKSVCISFCFSFTPDNKCLAKSNKAKN